MSTVRRTLGLAAITTNFLCATGFYSPIFLPRVGRCRGPSRWWTSLANRESRVSEIRLLVDSKIFGMEDTPKNNNTTGSKGGIAMDKADDGAEETGDTSGYEECRTVDDCLGHAERARELAEEVARKFPDIGRVIVDEHGNRVGGVDPFEGTAYSEEDNQDSAKEEEEEEWPEVAGVIGSMNDPQDAPWRIEAENVIRATVRKCGLFCYDILWTFHKLEVTITKEENPPEGAEDVGTDVLTEVLRRVKTALQQREHDIMELRHHELIIATPGLKNILTMARDFEAYKGFDVVVKTGGELTNDRELAGKLLKRTYDEVMITQSEQVIRIPLALVDEIRLDVPVVDT